MINLGQGGFNSANFCGQYLGKTTILLELDVTLLDTSEECGLKLFCLVPSFTLPLGLISQVPRVPNRNHGQTMAASYEVKIHRVGPMNYGYVVVKAPSQ